MTASITLMSSIDHADATRIAALHQALIALGFTIEKRRSGRRARPHAARCRPCARSSAAPASTSTNASC